ncbi:hypothetical protein AOLI_G00000760 [Acnodon oligacanthus]
MTKYFQNMKLKGICRKNINVNSRQLHDCAKNQNKASGEQEEKIRVPLQSSPSPGSTNCLPVSAHITVLLYYAKQHCWWVSGYLAVLANISARECYRSRRPSKRSQLEQSA